MSIHRTPKTTRSALTSIDQHLLAVALRKNELISFDAMHPSMAKLPSAQAAALAFAEVNTLIGHLHATVGYDGLRKMIEMIRMGKNPRRAVADAVGTTWAEVEAGWKRYLAAARLKPDNQLAARAKAPRIRFKKGKGDDESVGIEEVATYQAWGAAVRFLIGSTST